MSIIGTSGKPCKLCKLCRSSQEQPSTAAKHASACWRNYIENDPDIPSAGIAFARDADAHFEKTISAHLAQDRRSTTKICRVRT